MNNQPYSPCPINTDGVELPIELVALAETLAENVHEVWAKGRIDEGWVYGKERDNQAKTHPCLVEYSMLPDSEKEYDRQTAIQTLKLIMKLGFDIVKHN